MRRSLLLAICALLAAAGHAKAQTETLRVAQYNVQFATPWDVGEIGANHWPNTAKRARAIGRALACFDIVALNESINDRRRAEILRAMEAEAPECAERGDRTFELIAGPKLPADTPRLTDVAALAAFATSDAPLPLVDDELAIISRLPVLATGTHVYSVGRGSDALAAKGVLHARLWRGNDAPLGHAIDVFVTHLQANHRDIRTKQLQELVQFVRSRSDPTRPALLLGDFNVDGSARVRRDPGAEYHQMIRQLAALGFRDLGQTMGGTNTGERRRIDYIFLRATQLRPIRVRAELFTTLRHRALSDHAAVTADLRWMPPTPQRRLLARAVPAP